MSKFKIPGVSFSLNRALGITQAKQKFARETGKRALHFKGCKGLLIIAAIILAGQIAMVEIPGLQNFFNVTGLKFEDWVIIIVGSSLVLWIREIWSLLKKI